MLTCTNDGSGIVICYPSCRCGRQTPIASEMISKSDFEMETIPNRNGSAQFYLLRIKSSRSMSGRVGAGLTSRKVTSRRVGTKPSPMLNGYRSLSLMRPIAGSKAAHWTRLAVAQLAKSTLDALAHMIERRDADPVAHHFARQLKRVPSRNTTEQLLHSITAIGQDDRSGRREATPGIPAVEHDELVTRQFVATARSI